MELPNLWMWPIYMFPLCSHWIRVRCRNCCATYHFQSFDIHNILNITTHTFVWSGFLLIFCRLFAASLKFNMAGGFFGVKPYQFSMLRSNDDDVDFVCRSSLMMMPMLSTRKMYVLLRIEMLYIGCTLQCSHIRQYHLSICVEGFTHTTNCPPTSTHPHPTSNQTAIYQNIHVSSLLLLSNELKNDEKKKHWYGWLAFKYRISERCAFFPLLKRFNSGTGNSIRQQLFDWISHICHTYYGIYCWCLAWFLRWPIGIVVRGVVHLSEMREHGNCRCGERERERGGGGGEEDENRDVVKYRE